MLHILPWRSKRQEAATHPGPTDSRDGSDEENRDSGASLIMVDVHNIRSNKMAGAGNAHGSLRSGLDPRMSKCWVTLERE